MRSGGIPETATAAESKRTLVAALLAALCGSPSCSRSPLAVAQPATSSSSPSIRCGRTASASTAASDLTPRLDRIAREGAYAANAMTHVPLTRPSHATILSGLLPWEVGVRDNLAPAELPSSPLLAEILKGAGFHTGAFVSSIVLERRGGFGRGFDRYDDDFPKTQSADLLSTLQKPGAETLRAAIAWLESQRAADRICLWVHLFEPHDPYEPPEPYASRYRDRPYDGEVAYADALVGQLDDALQRLGLESETLLAVASDHGEGLGEHQETLHGFFVYQTTLAVPLILRGPGIVAGGRIAANVGLVDLLPTALDLLGVALPRGFQPSGNSLGASAPRRDRRRRPIARSMPSRWCRCCISDGAICACSGEDRGSTCWRPKPELYDLASDPHEQHNLVGGAAGASRGSSRDAGEDARRRNAASATTATARTLPAGSARTARRPRLRERRSVHDGRRRAPIRRTRSSSSGRPTKACGRDSGVESTRLRRRGARVRGIDWQRHRELRGAPVSRPIVAWA